MSKSTKILGVLLAGIGLVAAATWAFRGTRPASPRAHPGQPLRIVSLAPNVTEMLFRLGAGEALVGVTDYCDYPPAAKQIERVGEFGKPNLERLLTVAPDLVLAAGLERNDLVPILRESGIRVLDLRIRNIDEMLLGLREIGQAVGRSEQAEESIAAMRAELKSIADQATGAPRLRVFVEICDNPLTTAGGSSFLDDVITRAGGTNVAHDLAQPYVHVSPETLIQWDPEVIVSARMTAAGDPAAAYSQRIGWAGVSAVKHGRIIADIPADWLFRPGPRLIDGVKVLAQRLRGAPPENEFAARKADLSCP
jgi:iron complex transport system substrate-binding protein